MQGTQNQEEEQTIDNQRIELVKRVADDSGTYLSADCKYKDTTGAVRSLEPARLDEPMRQTASLKFSITTTVDAFHASLFKKSSSSNCVKLALNVLACMTLTA